MNIPTVHGSEELVTYTRPTLSADARRLPPAEPEPPSGDGMTLSAYWYIVLKRRWTVLTVVLVATTLAAIASFRMKPIYRATSRVQVEAETPLIQSINDLYQRTDTDDAFLETQIEVLKSENLAWQTVEQLRLGDNAAFISPKLMAKQNAQQQRVTLIREFQDHLDVELVPKTRMLTVGFESQDPNLSAHVANALVTNYIDYNFRQKYDATRQASGWMEQQLDELKAKVEKSQQALVDYEREHAIADVGNSKDKESVEEQMLSDLSKDLTTAQGDRIAKESLYNQVIANRSQIAALAHNELLQKLEETGAGLKSQYLEALNQYGPKFPKVIRLKDQVAENQAQITQEQNRVIERIRNDYMTAVNREKLAVAAVNRQKEALGNSNQLLVQRNILQRDFDANQQLYQNLMQRLKDATVSAGLRSTNIHQVDTALAPDKPVRPKKVLNISIGFIVGLMLGLMLAFTQEAMDDSVGGAEEIENMLAVPSLGFIPLQRLPARGTQSLTLRAKTDKPIEQAPSVITKPNSVFAEAFRSLRTAILLSTPTRPPQTLLITSAQPGEGKSTSALNLAMVLAQRKGPVLVIDADMRRAGISGTLRLKNDSGLSAVLSGTNTIEEAIQQHELLPELWVMPAGPVPPSPADLLSSDKMAEILQVACKRFEHIVIDTPPVLSVTDATILSRMVDGVVLVVQSGTTTRGGLVRTVRTLHAAGARILGVLLNKLDNRHRGYGYAYYERYYGGAYYGDATAYGEKQ